MQELTPTGKLRVAIAISPSPSAYFTVKDANGELRGVAIELGKQLAEKLRVPVEYVAYPNSGTITDTGDFGEWDVTFLPADEERRKKIQFGPAYHLLQSTYLVPAGSKIQTLAEVDRPGVRVIGIENTATIRAAIRSLKHTSPVAMKTPDEAFDTMRSGGADALALSRESLQGMAAKLPGSRILDGGFLDSVTAIAVPKNKPDALAYVSEFIEEAKASGAVRRAFDAMGLTSSAVAPAGMR
jgi:polar amino acid transport system substrate-binding protein